MTTSELETQAGVIPHLMVQDAAQAILFYQNVFGAVELFRMPYPNSDRIMHAELQVNGGALYLCDVMPEGNCGPGAADPLSAGSTAVVLHLEVLDPDALYYKALEHGATSRMAVQDMFWGARYGQVRDPYGHVWSLSSKPKAVSAAEMKQGAEACMAN